MKMYQHQVSDFIKNNISIQYWYYPVESQGKERVHLSIFQIITMVIVYKIESVKYRISATSMVILVMMTAYYGEHSNVVPADLNIC